MSSQIGRLYLPLIAGLHFYRHRSDLRRWKTDRTTPRLPSLAGICLVARHVATYSRAPGLEFTASESLWIDTSEKAPNKERTQFGVAVAYFHAHTSCQEAVDHYAKAAALEKA